jgi:L-histidine N-alpha-methyltransferase
MSTTEIIGAAALEEFASDVRRSLSLTPRELSSRYLYDPLGSALFDAICLLPWYGITRAEMRLLTREAGRVVTDRRQSVVELGPGNGSKMLALLSHHAPRTHPLAIHLIDVSATALRQAARTLEQLRSVHLVMHEMSYEHGFEAFATSRDEAPALAMFLGSNIGNFAPADARAFLRRVRQGLRTGDGFLLGADLVKPERRLLDAYDDPLGVTAAFNRNLLVRLQSQLGAQLDLNGFRHKAVWNAAQQRVEMHLVSRRDQQVVIPASGLDFMMAAGETIWTESSYKYEPEGISRLLEACGFSIADQWIDDIDRFALTHAIVT